MGRVPRRAQRRGILVFFPPPAPSPRPTCIRFSRATPASRPPPRPSEPFLNHPPPPRTKPHPADLARLTPRATGVDRNQRQHPAALPRITRRPSQPPRCLAVVIASKHNRSRHGKPPRLCHGESYLPPSRESP